VKLHPPLRDLAATTVGRHPSIVPGVIFLDGVSGTGKTMLAPILSTFRRVEVQRIDYIYESICALHFLGRVEDDAAVALIRMYVDLACYNVMIARESNFRWSDLSGVLRNPGGFRYLRRLFERDGRQVLDVIRQRRPILQLICHHALPTMVPLFAALGERLTLVEMVRHPLYLLEHWYSYNDRYGTDPLDFTVWLNHGAACLPWFARGWEEKYLASNRMDRVIHSLDRITRLGEDLLEGSGEEIRRRVIEVIRSSASES